MDILVQSCASILLILSILYVVWAPFWIDEDRGPFTAGHYVITMLMEIAIAIVAGRVVGWW